MQADHEVDLSAIQVAATSDARGIALACTSAWCTWAIDATYTPDRVTGWPSVAEVLDKAQDHIRVEHAPAPHTTCIETTNYRAGATGRTYVCGPECPGVSRETSAPDVADPAWTGYPLQPATSSRPAVGMPTDERALRDRERTGCLLRSGQLCPCPAGAFAYDGCERIKVVG